ncbi:hypothetical protein Tco_0494274 [Tanacetum coccineum]
MKISTKFKHPAISPNFHQIFTKKDRVRHLKVPLRSVGDRTQDEWNELVDWWSHPNRVSRSLQNAANRAKNMILTHEGKKSFAQGRMKYLDMKAMQEMIKAGIIPFKTDQEILDEVVPSDNRQNMSGMGRKLPRVVAQLLAGAKSCIWRCYDSGSDTPDSHANKSKRKSCTGSKLRRRRHGLIWLR